MDVKVATTPKPKLKLSPKAKADYKYVVAAMEGDQKAYTILMEKYYNSVKHLMLKMVKNNEDAEDLVLEAFGKAFHKLHSYTPNYAFSTWLFKIAINNCIDHIRKKRLKLLSIDDTIGPNNDSEFSHNIISSVLNPEQRVIREQRLSLMRNVIGKLNYKYRLMIELRFFEELSYDEIAKELEIPLGTVKAQLFRAKQILFGILQQPGAEDYLEPQGRSRQNAGSK